MKRRRLTIYLVAILGIAGVLALAVNLFSPPAPLLLQRATKVADVQEDSAYCWLSSKELLLVTNTSRRPDPWGLWSGHIDTIDPQTRQRTRLEGLTAAIMCHADHYNALHGPMMFSPSPDGKWLRWSAFTPVGDKSGRGAFVATARMDGSGYHEWPSPGFAITSWLDGHRWGGPVYASRSSPSGSAPEAPTSVIVHDPAHPTADRLLPADSPEARKMLTYMITSHSPGRQSATLAGFSEDKHTNVEIDIMSTPTGAAAGTLPSKLDTLIYPPGSWLVTEETNPQQTRVLLFVHESGIPLWVSFVRKLLPAYSYSSHPFEHLCFYKADTREVIEIGRIDETPSHDETSMKISWLPDGKNIQFFYKNAVYIVPTQ